DVAPALHRLRDAGFRLVTLTNNPTVVCEAQLAAAGLRDLFERLFSVDEGPRRYKPAPESYAAVADALDLPPGELCLVACHTWDTLGAAAAGLRTALLLRPGNAPLALGRAPDFVATDLAVLADQLIATVS
ncbi:MAG: HAD-IA family hydrolase, partial [Gluconacetobacter diazotrophicus]|nr:HAD-IA family hydrolase [Gluconacetobacter diazotrophicus]